MFLESAHLLVQSGQKSRPKQTCWCGTCYRATCVWVFLKSNPCKGMNLWRLWAAALLRWPASCGAWRSAAPPWWSRGPLGPCSVSAPPLKSELAPDPGQDPCGPDSPGRWAPVSQWRSHDPAEAHQENITVICVPRFTIKNQSYKSVSTMTISRIRRKVCVKPPGWLEEV